MGRTDPSLVPEWLKSADYQTEAAHERNRSYVNRNDHCRLYAASSDRATSLYFRRSNNNNGSAHLRTQNSGSRNRFDREWERDAYDSSYRDDSILRNNHHRDFSRFVESRDCDSVKKRGETWKRRVVEDSNCFIAEETASDGARKTFFEKSFPSIQKEPSLLRLVEYHLMD